MPRILPVKVPIEIDRTFLSVYYFRSVPRDRPVLDNDRNIRMLEKEKEKKVVVRVALSACVYLLLYMYVCAREYTWDILQDCVRSSLFLVFVFHG